MAEEKKNGKSIEITFKLKDHLTNTGIGNAEIELYSKTDNKFSKKGKSSNNGIVKITIDEKDLKKKLYVKINKTSVYYQYPYPNDKLPTYAVCYKKKVQEVRFLSKKCIIGIVKAYNHQIGSIYSSESEYLSNWQDEILTIDKEQTITLKAFIVSNISEEGIREPNGRYFLTNSDEEEDILCIKWAFKITTNTKGFKIDTQAKSLQVILASITLNNETKQDTTKFNTIDQINTNNIYKLVKSGKEVTGHTIDFRLSDIFTENLIKESSLYKYHIVFFAYEFEEDKNIVVKYDSSEDNLPLKQLKIVANKYSMIFDGYHLELYKNGKYVESYNARLTENGNLRKREEFKFTQKDGIDDLYKCEAKLRSKVVDNILRRVLYLKPDSDNNDVISNFIVDNVMLSNIENQLKPKKDSDNDNQSNTQNNITSKVIHISSIDFIKIWHKIQFQSDILVKFIYHPKYVIEVTRYKEVYNSNKSIQNMKERYGATYGVFAIYVYYLGEKFLLDSVIDAYNSEHTDNTINKEKNLTSEHIKELNSFVNNPKNHHSIKTDMYEKDLQNKATYGNLKYGGYTMEPSGPDNITEEVKRRIPEGHYKGIYHHSDDPYKNYTMNLYSDMVRSQRYILVHAGIQNMIYTTGCILVSTESYETGNNYDEKALTHYGENSAPAMKILQRLDNLYKALYDHNINKTLRSNDDISSCISLVIRNQMNRG